MLHYLIGSQHLFLVDFVQIPQCCMGFVTTTYQKREALDLAMSVYMMVAKNQYSKPWQPSAPSRPRSHVLHPEGADTVAPAAPGLYGGRLHERVQLAPQSAAFGEVLADDGAAPWWAYPAERKARGGTSHDVATAIHGSTGADLMGTSVSTTSSTDLEVQGTLVASRTTPPVPLFF